MRSDTTRAERSSLTPLLPIVLSFAAACIYLAVIQQDLTRRRIPNPLPLVLTVIAGVKWLVLGALATAIAALAAAVLVFVVGALLFWRGWMGGGDVKLLAASSFLLGAPDTYALLLWTTLIGGVLSIFILAQSLIMRHKGRRGVRGLSSEDGSNRDEGAPEPRTVPYGVAIAGASLSILLLPFLKS